MKATTKDIIRTLIDVINQACQVRHDRGKFFCSPMALSAYEDAFHVLEFEGYARRIQRGKYRGLYELAWEPKFLKEKK